MSVLFQVDLSFMPVSEILQWIDMNRLSCVASISAGDDGLTLYMDKGKIVFATSKKKGIGFGEHLVRSGALNQVQVFQALSESRQAGIPVTRHLIETNQMSLDSLNDAFAGFVQKLVLEVFPWKTGTVAVTAPLPDVLSGSPVMLNTSKVVLECARIQDELNRASQQRDAAIQEINRRLYQEDFQLPVLPTIIMQLISLMEDEKTTFQDMAKLIMTDQVLISRILKVANSPFYGGAGQVDSIQFAIVRLGMREIVNIVTGIKINSLGATGMPQEKLQKILDDALKIAFVASGLARHCGQDPEEVFLGGLLLDLGKTVILGIAQNLTIDQVLLDELLEKRHSEIGALIAKKWNYPESIQNLIRYHHARNIGDIVNPMIALVQTADRVIQEGPETGMNEQLLEALGLTPETVVEMYHQAIESFERIKSA